MGPPVAPSRRLELHTRLVRRPAHLSPHAVLPHLCLAPPLLPSRPRHVAGVRSALLVRSRPRRATVRRARRVPAWRLGSSTWLCIGIWKPTGLCWRRPTAEFWRRAQAAGVYRGGWGGEKGAHVACTPIGPGARARSSAESERTWRGGKKHVPGSTGRSSGERREQCEGWSESDGLSMMLRVGGGRGERAKGRRRAGDKSSSACLDVARIPDNLQQRTNIF